MRLEEDPVEPNEPSVASPLPTPRYRQCNASKLGTKRAEVERLLLEGEPKLKIARALKISAQTVRAVARQMDPETLAPPSREVATMSNGERIRKSLPETLKEKAIQAVGAITTEKVDEL